MKKGLRGALLVAATAALAVCGFALAACGESSDGHEHSYVWTDGTPATCETAGTRIGTCSVCGEQTTETVAALGHDWGTAEVVTPATCEGEGSQILHCSRCTETKTESIDPLGHDYDDEHKILGKRATCTEDGFYTIPCSRCTSTQSETIPATGHSWQNLDYKEEPTCTEPGLRTRRCSKCKREEDVDVPALGHTPSGNVIREDPTFDAPGREYYLCGRCWNECEEKVIPQLDANTKILYDFTLKRTDGSAFSAGSLACEVVDVATGDVCERVTMRGGAGRALLLPKEYTLRVASDVKGFTTQSSDVIRPGNPKGSLTVKGSVIDETMPSGTRYSVGSAMYDVSFTTIDGVTLTLSQLLEEKEIVVFNFFYVDCIWCQREFPGLERAYEAYSDDIALVALCTQASDTAESIRANTIREFGLTFPFVLNTDPGTRALYSAFNVTGAPTTVIIDREGVVIDFEGGAVVDIDGDNYDAERPFRELFERCLAASRSLGETSAPAAPVAMLPGKFFD